MKYIVISITLIPAITSGSFISNDIYHVTKEYVNPHRTLVGSRQIKVTVSRSEDDDHTDGNDSKTVTIERNQDDDHTNGSKSIHKTSRSKTATSPYAISKDVVVTATTTSTTTTDTHHHNITHGDSIEFDDDSISSNATTPISDMKAVMNANIEHDSDATLRTSDKVVLPPEHALSETWTIAIVALFVSMAVSLCATTAIRRCRNNNRRSGYHEVTNIVV